MHLSLCQIPSPQEVSNTSVVGQSIIWTSGKKHQEKCHKNPLYLVIFPFFVSILLKSLPLLTIPINAVKPGVNVLFKQPTIAEKWRHNPGLISRARWTLPLSALTAGSWAAKEALPGHEEPNPSREEEKYTFGCHKRAGGSRRLGAGAPAHCPLPRQLHWSSLPKAHLAHLLPKLLPPILFKLKCIKPF